MSRLKAIAKELYTTSKVVDQTCSNFFHRLRPGLYRHIRWPVRKPYQRASLKIVSPGGGIGDELMASGVVRSIKEANPACQITFVTRYPEFWSGHPLFHDILSSTEENKWGGLELSYRYQIPSRENVFRLIGERVGLQITELHPAPPLPTLSPWLEKELKEIHRPYILVQPETSSWTTNKTWPQERWQQVMEDLTKDFLVIEVGTQPMLTSVSGDNFRSFAGRTSLLDLAYLISKAKLYLGAESGGMHMAAGFDIPSVIVFGGYTSPENFPYPRNIPLYTPVSCAPCWLREPCPYGLKCLAAISAEQVIQTTQNFLNNNPG